MGLPNPQIKFQIMKHILILLLAIIGNAVTASAQTASDSIGLYAVIDGHFSPVDIINYRNIKVSPGFYSAKSKLEFDGATSPHHFKGEAHFRIYFGQPSPYDTARLFMFTPAYTIKDFGFAKFEKKKKSRQLQTGNFGIFRTNTIGATETDLLTYEIKEVRPLVYDIKVKGEPGEYCIMHTFRGSGGYSGVFDFTIE